MDRLKQLIGDSAAKAVCTRIDAFAPTTVFSRKELHELIINLIRGPYGLADYLRSGGEPAAEKLLKLMRDWTDKAVQHNISLDEVAHTDIFLRQLAEAATK